MNKSNLMTEYENITNELNNIRSQIVALKNVTETKMKTAKSENEKSSIFIDFKNKVDKLHQDTNTKKKYKTLQKRKLEIETEISNINSDTQSNIVMDDIKILIQKYKKNINVPINIGQYD